MNTIIRIENAALALAALFAFHIVSGDWILFALLILVPDISFLGYLGGPRTGAICYNVLHSWIGPVLLFGAGFLFANDWMTVIALIWAAHIGIDRAIGYGLKHFSGFKDTHLGKIGGSG